MKLVSVNRELFAYIQQLPSSLVSLVYFFIESRWGIQVSIWSIVWSHGTSGYGGRPYGIKFKEGKFLIRMKTFSTVTVSELAVRHESGHVDLVDVRTPTEFNHVRATIARNVPLDRLDPAFELSQGHGTLAEPLYVICDGGTRSAIACRKLMDERSLSVVNVEGGTQMWEQAGLPVVRGRKAISLERQGRIAAGFLLLVGIAAALLVHPYFVGVSAFVGAGLMFAGITDTCGMALLLGKMPWNHHGDKGH